jgi:hypothetical protein
MYSAGFQAAVTESFHLINTVRVATEHLTRDVRKVVNAGADDKVLEALYAMPTFATGQNLRAFTSRSSEDHERELANLWLFTVIGQFEVWADELPVSDSSDGCQFPSRGSSQLSTRRCGFNDVFGSLPPSAQMAAAFGPSVATDLRNLGPRVDDALALYRLYKECRNSLAHAGGKASQRVEDWGAEVASRAGDLHVDRHGTLLQPPSFTAGQSVKLSIEQVRCLVSVLFRIAQTVESAILLSEIGEAEFIQRWQSAHGSQPLKVESNKLKRSMWLLARCQEAGVATPSDPLDVGQLLVAARLVKVLR